jgi:lysozyme
MGKLIEDLKRDEGFREFVYQDSEGYWTIGYGRMVDIKLGGGITEEEGVVLLINDINEVVKELDYEVPWWRQLPPNAQRGFANMAFNLGWPRLSRFVKMLAALEDHDFELAAEEALDSKWADQVGERADRIADLYRSCAK